MDYEVEPAWSFEERDSLGRGYIPLAWYACKICTTDVKAGRGYNAISRWAVREKAERLIVRARLVARRGVWSTEE